MGTAIVDALLRLIGATAFMVIVVVGLFWIFDCYAGNYLDTQTEGRWKKIRPYSIWVGLVALGVFFLFVFRLNS